MKIKKRMHVVDYREAAFIGEHRPCLTTIKNWIKNGSLPGEKIGGRYYVYVESSAKVTATGNAMADNVLRETGLI